MKKFNKEKYLERIHYPRRLDPDWEVLRQLQKQHLLHVPFENLDIHYQTPIELNIDRIYKKVVLHRRGGYCYELNGLFYELLRSLGFNVKQISARVFTGDSGFTPEFDHLTLLVPIGDTEYLTDVGFGEFTFGPLKLELEEVQDDALGRFVIEDHGDGYLRVSKIDVGQTVPVYMFNNKVREFREFEKMNRYHQTSPHSPFMKKRLVSLPTQNGRITLTGNMLKIRENKSTTEKELKSEAEFEQALWDLFEIKIEKSGAKK